MDEPRNIVSAMANGVGAAAEVEILLWSHIFVFDGRVHVVVVDEVMGPRRVSSRICWARDATNEPPGDCAWRSSWSLFRSVVILRRKNLRANNSAKKYLTK
jgi:hypothetical protein